MLDTPALAGLPEVALEAVALLAEDGWTGTLDELVDLARMTVGQPNSCSDG